MSDLVQTLIIGFFTSIILIFLAWLFWRRFDKPSEKQLEVEEERKEKSKEIKMWRAVESQMKQEEAEAEAEAAYQLQKAEERARAVPPDSQVVSNAFAALEAPTEGEEFNERFKPNGPLEQIEVEELTELIQTDDSDVLLAPELVSVRQDEGEQSQELLSQLQQDDELDDLDEKVIEVEPYEDNQEDDNQATEVEPFEDDNITTKQEDEQPIVDEKAQWNSKQQDDEDDPWSVGW